MNWLRHKHTARYGLLAVVGAGFLSVAMVIAAPNAMAYTPPLPVIPTPPPVVGGALAEGAAGAGGVAVADGAILVAAGAGAYAGTCWALRLMHPDARGCPDIDIDILGLHMGFGAKGDVRTTYDGGPVGTLTQLPTTPGSDFAVSYNVFPEQGSLNAVRIRAYYRVHTAQSSIYCYAFSHEPTSATGVLSVPLSGNCGGGSNPTFLSHVIMYNFNDTQIESTPLRFQNDSVAFMDPGIGSAWTVRYTQHCKRANGTTFENHVDQTFTPSVNGTSPTVDLTPCWELEPGSHAVDFGVVGGRAGITSPNPDVNIVQPTYSGEDATSYPLCTTNAPAGGCWLDLQRDGKSCFGPNVYCAGWPQNVSRWQMSCEWGPYQVATERCVALYGTRFDLQTQPNPSPSPTVAPPNPPAPCMVNCTTPPIPPVDPENPKDGGDNCISDAFSLNPIDWVYVPVKCVLIWAFVPEDLPDFSDVPSPIPPGWIPSFPALTNGSCGPLVMPSLEFPIIGSTSSRTIVNTCSAPWPTVRGFTYYGLLAGGLIALMQRAFYAVSRAAGMDVDTSPSRDDD